MKKYILLFIIAIPFCMFSQDNYTFKNGGKVLLNNNRIYPSEIRYKFSSNPAIVATYDAGRLKKTFGTVLLYGGLGIFTGNLLYDLTTDTTIKSSTYGSPNNDKVSVVGYIIGGALALISIPIKIGYSNKIRQAIDLMNKESKSPKTTEIESANIIVNTNGVGFAITF